MTRDASPHPDAGHRDRKLASTTVQAVAPTRHRYGDDRGQTGDLWLPTRTGSGRVPVVVLFHGGYWRSIYTKAVMNRLARAVAARGWAAWNVEYRRLGVLGGGGGWPTTLTDAGAAVDHVARLPEVDPDRVVTCGHSAGGLLALWAASRRASAPDVPGSTAQVEPRAAVSLAGVVDLGRGAELSLGGGAVARFMGGPYEEHPERYRACSPAALLPLGIPQVLVHGSLDTVVPPSMSADYQRAAGAAGDDARYEPIEGLGHRQLIDPASAAWPVLAGHLERIFST
jgi:acetyl esterase/lipase